MFQAGLDELVELAGQLEVKNQMSRCTLETFPGAFHEILQERDEIRDRALKWSKTFLSD